jgi:hemerythrin
MAILWTDDLATKIDTIDNQHKMLFEIVNELLDSCKQGKGFEVVKKVVFFLDDYVKKDLCRMLDIIFSSCFS